MPSHSCFGRRHVVVLLCNFGLLLVYCMRVNLSVALMAMVKRNDTSKPETNDCPITNVGNSTRNSFVGKQYHWPRELEGWILSSFFWGYILLQVPSGWLAQRYGGKFILGAGISATAGLTLLTPLVAELNVYLFIVLRFLEGLCESVSYPTVLAMLGRWSPREESTMLFALSTVGGIIGTVVGQTMAGPICESKALGGWPAVFYISGGAGLLWLIPWVLFIYNSPESHPYISEEEKNYIIQSTGGLQEETNKRPIPWKRILTSRVIHVYLLCIFVAAWVKYTLLTCLPQFLSDVLHFDLTTNGLVASAPYISFIFVSNALSLLCEMCVGRGCIGKTNMKRSLNGLGFLGCGACLFAISRVPCNDSLIITLLVVGYSFYSGVIPGLASNSLDLSPEYSGVIFGIGNVFGTLAGIISPIVTDVIADNGTVFEWNIVFYISTGATVVAGLVYCLFGSAERQNWHLEDDEGPSSSERSPLVVNCEHDVQK